MINNYRTDQIGSLIRPARLLDARDAFKAGRLAREELSEIEDEAILDVLKRQRNIGIAVLSDGEFRRDAWQTVFSEAVDGFEESYPFREVRREDGTVARLQMHTKAICGRLEQRRRLAETDAAFLKSQARGPFKITLPSPALVARASWKNGVTDKAYRDREALLADTTAIVKGELATLAKDGVPYLQLDEGFTVYVDSGRAVMLGGERGREAAIEADIAAENSCYADARAAGAVTAMHVCRGSRAGFLRGSGGYDWLAERLFDRLDVDRFLLEYDDRERAGGFEPLRNMPKGKVAVLGLVNSTNPELEKRDDLLRKIEVATRFCPVEQLAISSQCGFQGSGTRDGAHMTADQQWRKLELIVETAQKVWG